MKSSIQIKKNIDFKKAAQVFEKLKTTRPKTKQQLKNYIKIFLNLNVPNKKICPQHSSPMDYLWHSFAIDFEPVVSLPNQNQKSKTKNGDAIVWANRGGGKTQLAAIATLLDCIFKPNCQTRILGGSGEQSQRMYDYLLGFIDNGFEKFTSGAIRKNKCQFKNASAVEVLTQSPTSVRGQHIQKLRCDEIELFEKEVFAAAAFTTQSTENITAAMEIISTMHKPYGLMQKQIALAEKNDTPVFKWCIWETIEKCVGRNCSQCPLWPDCGGKAKIADGYLKIDDCITAMRRASRKSWEAEMLCKRPNLENIVFDQFDPQKHVKTIDYNPNLPLYRTLDFGFVNPFVCLWIQPDNDGKIYVIDEYLRSRATIDSHADEMKKRTPISEEKITATFCDPAGAGKNDVTGTSSVRELRSLGIITHYRKSSIAAGIELVRRAILGGDGKSRLVISNRCPRLIEALSCYHYAEDAAADAAEVPLKDGVYDHPLDALRYFFVNYNSCKKAKTRCY